MQKISSYLYPNRINVVADVALFPVRWNIVYQNRVKIYQGVDNVLTLDVKNSDQKRIDISEMTLKMSITDTLGRDLATVDVTPGVTTGLATITIAEDALANITPQFLNFTIYRENEDDTKTVLYADTQFGAKGNIELIGSVLATGVPARYITRFIPITNTNTGLPWRPVYYSDAVEIRQPNILRASEDDTVDLNFEFKALAGTVTVQYTTSDVVSTGTDWVDIEAFTVTTSTVTLTKTYSYPTYTREMAWFRVKYDLEIGNTGTLDKVTVLL
jgi:hypothetical protein